MTTEQQKIAEELYPVALRIAARYRDKEEAEGVALKTLCEAVHGHDPLKGLTVMEYAKMCIRNSLHDWHRRGKQERIHGLSGGAPTRQQIEAHSTNGRKVRKTEEGARGSRRRNLDETLATPADAPEWVADVISKLPIRLRRAAKLRWYGRYTQTMLADTLGLSYSGAYRLIHQLEGFARLFLSGGGV